MQAVTNLPDRPTPAGELVERQLSNRDFELVIRRAAELQARDAEGGGSDGISETEALRIGRELGLSTEHLHRALAEVNDTAPPENGLLVRLFGPRVVHASRTVAGDASMIGANLERYLVEREYLTVLRRFSDRVVYTRASGVAAAMGRATSQIFSRSPLLRVENLEVSIRPLEAGYAHLYLATSLGDQRSAAAASSILGGTLGTSVGGAALGIAIAPPAALIALPILGLSILGGRAYYKGLGERVQVQLESLLDRIAHDELPEPTRGWAQPPRSLPADRTK